MPCITLRKTTDPKRKIDLHREKMCPIYVSVFRTAKIFGILPYDFDPDTLQLTPIHSGFPYYFFLFNLGYLVVTLSKNISLFLQNWWTNFEEEKIKGGYFMQLAFVSGYGLLYAMLHGYTFNRQRFASAVSSVIRLEARILRGKYEIYGIP